MQLVNIGSQYSYSSDDQSEFLVVVSRDFESPANASTKQTDKEKVLAGNASPLVRGSHNKKSLVKDHHHHLFHFKK